MTIVCVCETLKTVCDTNGNYPVKVGNVNYVFCCRKGFEQTLEDFRKVPKPAPLRIKTHSYKRSN